jgi:hypothetical protein
MARTTPAQKPRGFNKNKVLASVFAIMKTPIADLGCRTGGQLAFPGTAPNRNPHSTA